MHDLHKTLEFMPVPKVTVRPTDNRTIETPKKSQNDFNQRGIYLNVGHILKNEASSDKRKRYTIQYIALHIIYK